MGSIKDNAKKLFVLNNTSQTATQSVPLSNDKQEGETYQVWGHRMAGLASGSTDSLDPHLQIVYNSIKKEQAADAALQTQLQNKIQQDIANEQTALEQENKKLEQVRNKLQTIKQKIDDFEEKIAKLNADTSKPNKEAKANFIIGLFIIAPLTIYLFIFYSSTAYSAFFKEIDYTQALGSHMFDAQALTASWQQSWTAGLFVLLITFIFMALGFILHQFGKQQGVAKYIKSGSIIIVTFIFDTLLAYLIAKNMYDAEALTKIEEVEPYKLSMAFADARFWIVICCGFLAYIIWGLLFGFVMESYNSLDLNKVHLRQLENKMNKEKDKEEKEIQNENTIINNIEAIKGKIRVLEGSKSTVKQFDVTAIQLELNNFFSGWLQFMNAAAKSSEDKLKAQNIFDSFVNHISPNSSITNTSQPS